MSDCIEVIHGRRSIRRYLSKEIPEETMQIVLEAARWSPSWANTQCWELVLVRDQKLKQDLQGTLSDRNPSTIAVVDAPPSSSVAMTVVGRVSILMTIAASFATLSTAYALFE